MSDKKTTEKQTKAQRYLFIHEGQEVTIEPHIAQDQDLLKRLVSTWAPAAKTGTLEYSEPDAHRVVTITLATRAQPKGIQVVEADPVTQLRAAEAGENPILALYHRLNALYEGDESPVEAFNKQAEIEETLELGQEENARMEKICKRLKKAAPTEAGAPMPSWS